MTRRQIRITAATLALMAGLMAHLPRRAQAQTYSFVEDPAEPQVDISFTARTAVAGGLTVVFDHKDNQNFYSLELSPHSVLLRAVLDGLPHRLSSAAVAWAPSAQVTLKRRAWSMQVVIDRRVVLTAYDPTLKSGRIGSASSGGWNLQDARVQPVEELFFGDDFTRVQGQPGEWKTSSGAWTLTSSSDNISLRNQEMSANPFSYQVSAPDGRAFTQTGRWFWDDYNAEVSVRPAGRGTVGLAVDVQDSRNFLALLWSAPEGPSARQLVRVVNGSPTVLARTSGAYLPRQWYRVAVRTSPGYVETFIDGAPVFKVRNDWFGQGGIALLAQNISLASFDDVRVQSYSNYHADFGAASGADLNGGAWTATGGEWRPRDDVLTSAPVAGDRGATRVLLEGGSDWNGYQISVAGRTGGTGACGIVAGYRDDKNYTVFRWAGAASTLPFRGRRQLLRYQDGRAAVVSDEAAPASLPGASPGSKDGFQHFTLRTTAGALTVYAGQEPVAQMADESLGAGRTGLWAQGTVPVQFRDAVVSFPVAPQPPKVAPMMADDALMVGWASPSGEWSPISQEFWNTSEFFGDASLDFGWRPETYDKGSLELALRARRGEFDSGFIVRCEGIGSQKGVRVALLRDKAVLKQAELTRQDLLGDNGKVKASASSGGLLRLCGLLRHGRDSGSAQAAAGDDAAAMVPMRVELEGRAILLSVRGRPVLSYLDAGSQQNRGTSFAVRSTGFVPRPKELRAFSSHRDDYTFTEAPTDWYTPQGTWNVISRWPCYSDWSFFGGKGVNPVLWSKRPYSGDTVVEMYAHNQMDLPKEIGYSNPGNLNITLGADGKNPSSGYSFIIAGWDNTRTRILRGTQMVAENTSEAARFPRPINHNFPFHKHWYYIRAEARRARKNGRDGVNLKVSMDDTPLAEYFDPTPLDSFASGGRVAFWTVDSSIMIARAKIESEGMGTRALPVDLLDAAAAPTAPPAAFFQGVSDELIPQTVSVDGAASALVERQDGGGKPLVPVWTIKDPTAGGRFEVRLVKPGEAAVKGAAWDATAATRLQFDMAAPSEVNIDLYVTVDGVRHLIAFNQGEPPDARVRPLGTIQREAAGGGREQGWQHLSFDLGAALKKLYPDQSNWKIDEVALGVLHGNAYRLLGFGANPLGASYRLRHPRLTGS